MNVPKMGEIPLGKLRNILQNATKVPTDGRTYLARWTAGHVTKHWSSRPKSSLAGIEVALRTTSDKRCIAPMPLIRADDGNTRPASTITTISVRSQQHQENTLTSTPGPKNTAEVENCSEQAGGHSFNTRPSYKALSKRRQQKQQQ